MGRMSAPDAARASRRLNARAAAIVAMIVMAFIASVGVARAAPPMPDVVANDLAHRSIDIHWPAGFLPEAADMFSHNEIIIRADCSAVWRHLVAARKWPY
jgi:hypothetical protein